MSDLDIRAQLILARKRERAMDDEAIRRYIYTKDFDMEKRYDVKYRSMWAKKANMKPSRFNKALDRVIAEAWEHVKNGKFGQSDSGNGDPGRSPENQTQGH